jgi:hypothetical protein
MDSNLFPEQRLVVSLNVNRLVLMIEMRYVFCEVEPKLKILMR